MSSDSIPRPGGWSDRRITALALVVYTTMALFAFSPAWLHPESFILGDWRHPDCLSNHWLFQWIPDTLRAGGSILHNDRYYYPFGDAPFLAGNGSDAFFYAPFHYLFGWPVGLTYYYLLIIIGGCLGGYVFCRRVGASSTAAIFGGAVFGYSPYVFGELSAGRFAQVPTLWLALFCAEFISLLQTPSRRHAALAALLYAINAFVYWYYGLFATLAGALLAVSYLATHRDRIRACLAPLALFSFLCVALLAWPLHVFLSNWKEIPGITERFPHPMAIDSSLVPWWPIINPPRPEGALVFPLLASVCALYGLRRLVKRQLDPAERWLEIALWTVLIVFYLLTLGPFLKLWAWEPLYLIKLPYYWVYSLAGPLKRFWWPARHVLVVMLVLGALAARGLTVIATRWSARRALLMTLLFSLLLPLELFVRATTIDVKVSYWSEPDVYRALAAQPGTVLLELPLSGDVVTSQQSLIYQPLHKKRLINGHAMWVRRVHPPGYDEWVHGNSFLNALTTYETGNLEGHFKFDRKDLMGLQERGLRIVTVNREFYLVSFRKLYEGEARLMETLFGEPVARAPDFEAFDIAHWTGVTEVEVPVFRWPLETPYPDGNRNLTGRSYNSLAFGSEAPLSLSMRPDRAAPPASVFDGDGRSDQEKADASGSSQGGGQGAQGEAPAGPDPRKKPLQNPR